MQRQDVPPKYIFINGVMKKNPDYAKFNPAETKSTLAQPEQALAIVSTMDDALQASEAHQKVTGKEMKLADATVSSIEIMQDPEYLNKFKTSTNLDGGELLDKLTKCFAQYEVPLGMLNKLLALSEYKLNFMIDDSGSMNEISDMFLKDASPFMRKQSTQSFGFMEPKLTRWQEVEDRLHVMIDMLAWIPTNGITLRFLNRSQTICLSQEGKTPEKFAAEAHATIGQIFASSPSGRTPIHKILSQAFKSEGCNMHFLFTDGEPTDASTETVSQLVKTRDNPKNHALTFISCTSDNRQTNWMKEIEEIAPYTSEIDDFFEERKEVNKDQGPGFPYSKGFWLLCQLVSAINPNDLDALDESVPFCKSRLDNLMGRILPESEYCEVYFKKNPHAKNYQHVYNRLVNEFLTPQEIRALKQTSGFAMQPPTSSIGGMFSSGYGYGQSQPMDQKQHNLYSYRP